MPSTGTVYSNLLESIIDQRPLSWNVYFGRDIDVDNITPIFTFDAKYKSNLTKYQLFKIRLYKSHGEIILTINDEHHQQNTPKAADLIQSLYTKLHNKLMEHLNKNFKCQFIIS